MCKISKIACHRIILNLLKVVLKQLNDDKMIPQQYLMHTKTQITAHSTVFS